MISFWSFWTIQEFVKVSPIFSGQNPFPSYPSKARHTLTNYSWGMHSSQVFIQFILKVNICAKKAVCHYSFAHMANPFIRL